MPLERYMPDDPFENHPLFKTEEQARVEDTMDGVKSIVDEPTSLDWPGEETFVAAPEELEETQEAAGPTSPPTRTCGRARGTSTGATRIALRARPRSGATSAVAARGRLSEGRSTGLAPGSRPRP